MGRRRPVRAWVRAAAVAWLLCAAGEAAADVRVASGFSSAARDRWSFVRFDLVHPDPGPHTARFQLWRESGAREAWTRGVEGLRPSTEIRYFYEGDVDPVTRVGVELDGRRAEWRRPDRIPPSRVAVVVSADDGRALTMSTLLATRKGLGVARARPNALPDRWLAWRKGEAVVLWGDELPPRSSAEGRALQDYVRAGGTALLYAPDGGGDLFEGVDVGDVTWGRGRVLRMGRGGHSRPPALAPAPPPPAAAPMLVTSPAAAPVGWLGARAGWFVPLLVVAMASLRRHPRRGLQALVLVLVGAVWAPPPVDAGPAGVREARWEDGEGYVRREMALMPGRTGPLEIPAGTPDSVVALDPSAALPLSMSPEGVVTTPARWGRPVNVLVESLASAD